MDYYSFITLHSSISPELIKALLNDVRYTDQIINILLTDQKYFDAIGLIDNLLFPAIKLNTMDMFHICNFALSFSHLIEASTYKYFINYHFYHYYQNQHRVFDNISIENTYRSFINEYESRKFFQTTALVNLGRVLHFIYICKHFLYRDSMFYERFSTEVAHLIYNNLADPHLYDLLGYFNTIL